MKNIIRGGGVAGVGNLESVWKVEFGSLPSILKGTAASYYLWVHAV